MSVSSEGSLYPPVKISPVNFPEQIPIALEEVLGRVVAHELYHIFAKTTRHGSWGIAKAAYTVDELLCPKFEFEKRESNMLRAHHEEMAGFTDNAGQ